MSSVSTATHNRNVKKAKTETKDAIASLLIERNIEFEFVLGYACFKYRNKSFRTNTMLETKKVLNIL